MHCVFQNAIPDGSVLHEMDDDQTTDLQLDEDGELIEVPPTREKTFREKKKEKGRLMGMILRHVVI